MNSALLNYYEAIERASADMLDAARAGDWDQVVKLEGACVLLISQLKQAARELPLDIRGTAFQQQVWDCLRRIPAGERRSYTDVAVALGGGLGLVRLPDWDTSYTKSVADNFKQGDLVDVQVTEIGRDKRIRLSRRAVLLADSASGTTSGESEGGSGSEGEVNSA